MNKNTQGILVLGGLIAVLILVFFLARGAKAPNDDDVFAKCLSEKGAVMYGAYWCSHCKAQKALFGPSFKYVNYVECTEEEKKCVAAGVSGFPTWIFPDGRKFEGEQTLEELSEASGCPLN